MSAVFGVPGFINGSCKPDYMHAICLGILQYAMGNVVFELFKPLGGTIRNWRLACDEFLKMVKAMAHHLELDLPFAQLTVGMFKPKAKSKPRMALKAGGGRHFLPILLEILKKFFPATSDRERLRQSMIYHLNECYRQLDHWADESPHLLAMHGRMHLQCYKRLRDTRLDLTAWNLFPKHHLAIHCFVTVLNPKEIWNYSDESEIGTAAIVAGRCNGRELHVRMVERYVDTFDLFH